MPKTGKPILPAMIVWNEFSCYKSDVNDMASAWNKALGGANRGNVARLPEIELLFARFIP
jgi:hypothetical protein